MRRPPFELLELPCGLVEHELVVSGQRVPGGGHRERVHHPQRGAVLERRGRRPCQHEGIVVASADQRGDPQVVPVHRGRPAPDDDRVARSRVDQRQHQTTEPERVHRVAAVADHEQTARTTGGREVVHGIRTRLVDVHAQRGVPAGDVAEHTIARQVLRHVGRLAPQPRVEVSARMPGVLGGPLEGRVAPVRTIASHHHGQWGLLGGIGWTGCDVHGRLRCSRAPARPHSPGVAPADSAHGYLRDGSKVPTALGRPPLCPPGERGPVLPGTGFSPRRSGGRDDGSRQGPAVSRRCRIGDRQQVPLRGGRIAGPRRLRSVPGPRAAAAPQLAAPAPQDSRSSRDSGSVADSCLVRSGCSSTRSGSSRNRRAGCCARTERAMPPSALSTSIVP